MVLTPWDGEGNGTPFQYFCLDNPMDGGAWWAAIHGVATSQAGLSDFTFTFHFPALGKEMATHSSVLAWRIPGTGKPGGLPSMGSHRVGHDWSDLAAAAAAVLKEKEFCSILHQQLNTWPQSGMQNFCNSLARMITRPHLIVAQFGST